MSLHALLNESRVILAEASMTISAMRKDPNWRAFERKLKKIGKVESDYGGPQVRLVGKKGYSYESAELRIRNWNPEAQTVDLSVRSAGAGHVTEIASGLTADQVESLGKNGIAKIWLKNVDLVELTDSLKFWMGGLGARSEVSGSGSKATFSIGKYGDVEVRRSGGKIKVSADLGRSATGTEYVFSAESDGSDFGVGLTSAAMSFNEVLKKGGPPVDEDAPLPVGAELGREKVGKVEVAAVVRPDGTVGWDTTIPSTGRVKPEDAFPIFMKAIDDEVKAAKKIMSSAKFQELLPRTGGLYGVERTVSYRGPAFSGKGRTEVDALVNTGFLRFYVSVDGGKREGMTFTPIRGNASDPLSMPTEQYAAEAKSRAEAIMAGLESAVSAVDPEEAVRGFVNYRLGRGKADQELLVQIILAGVEGDKAKVRALVPGLS